MEAVIYYAETDGILLERMVRKGQFSMHVKHFHNQYEIFYLIEGERRFFFNNRAYTARGGSLILVDENLIHMTASASDTEFGHDRIILYIDKAKMYQMDQMFPHFGLVKFFKQNYGIFPLNPSQQKDFLNLYLKLQKEFDEKGKNYKAMIELNIMQYFIEFMRENHVKGLVEINEDYPAKYQHIYDVTDYISENFEKNLTLDSLASQFFISKYYLSRTFKEITGYGINEYINIHRIKKAKLLLEETDCSISEISQMLGYESVTYFEKVFKTYMTMPPLKYRKLLNTVTYTNTPTPAGF